MPLRPDLVFINDTDKVLHIVDVIIPLKSSETARAEKVCKKYTPLSDWFTSREYSASVSVLWWVRWGPGILLMTLFTIYT